MTERILGRTGSPRRRRFLLAPFFIVALVATAALFVTTGAQAIHNPGDTSLELDQNVADNPAGAPDDWNNFFPSAPADVSFTTGIVPDPEPQTIFTGAQSGGSSKDNQDISGWRWKCGSSPPKDEIADAASALYNVSGGEQRLYFMADREAVNGSSHLGVWFMKKSLKTSPDPPTCPAGSANPFSDVHSVGDILVLADFTQGGTIPNIKVFKWVGTGGTEPKSNGTLDRIGLGSDCIGLVHNAGDPELCGTVNSTLLGPGNGPDGIAGTNDDGPTWPYTPKSGADGSMPPGSFFEGGIDLGSLGLTGQCFGSVLTETRSSSEIDAVLKDFVLHAFEPCGSGIVTTPKQADGTTNIPPSGLSIGTGSVGVTDLAVVTATGATTDPTGTVTFFLCGPIATGNCATGGTQVGAVKTLNGGTPGDATSTATSDLVTVTSAGRYCFRGHYSGDGLYPPSDDPKDATDTSTTECFLVNPVTPTITTIATGPVTVGNAIDDTATLTGTASQPTGPPPFNTTGTTGAPADGTITFTLYGPSASPNCTTAIATRVVTVSGDGNYTASSGSGSGSLTPTQPGTYYWIAAYSGDSPNTNSATTSCGDAGESSVVTGNAQSSSAQRWLPNDRVTITGDANLNGTLTVTLYSGDNCGATSGSAISGQSYTFTFTNDTSPQSRNTTNTTFFVGTNPDGTAGGTPGDYSWLVHYDDTTLNDPADRCEKSTVSITD
jgi:hypothetical protein